MVPALQATLRRRCLQVIWSAEARASVFTTESKPPNLSPKSVRSIRNFHVRAGFSRLTKGAVARQFHPYTIPASQPPNPAPVPFLNPC